MAKSNEYQRVFTKKHPETGDEMRRTANSPADAVRFKFDGWVEETPTKATKSTTSSTTSTPAAKSASGSSN